MKKKIQTSRKRLLSVLLAVAMVLTALPLTALSAVAITNEDFEYEILSDDTVAITKYIGSSSDVIIPNSLNGYTVTEITFPGFNDNTSVKSITFPDSVKSISNCFAECTNLECIYVNNNNEKYYSIDGVLFERGRIYIDAYENRVPAVALHTYPNAKKDSSYTVPSGTEMITFQAFTESLYLTSVTIPSSVTIIEDGAFMQAKKLNTIDVQSDNEKFYSVNGVLFDRTYTINDNLYNEPFSVLSLLAYPSAKATTSYSIPSNVKAIGAYAFSHAMNLTNISSIGALRYIAPAAFICCENLQFFPFPSSLETIGSSAFFGCSSLKDIYLPSNLRFVGDGFETTAYACDDTNWENDALYIGQYLIKVNSDSSGQFTVKDGTIGIASFAFSNCDSVTSVVLPNGLLAVNEFAFFFCSNLQEVVLPSSLKYIDRCAFDSCSSLQEIKLPSDLEYLGASAFCSCQALCNVDFSELLESQYLTTIRSYTFGDCAKLKAVSIPKSVTIIEEDAFSGCTALTDITVVSDNTTYTSVDGVLFSKDLKQLVLYPNGKTDVNYVIPNSVTNIAPYAFENCTSLTSITIPYSVINISDYAFFSSRFTTIYGYTNSYAEAYARENGYSFIPITPDGALRLDLPTSGIIGQQVQIPMVLEDVALSTLDYTLQYDQTKLEFVSCTQNAFTNYSVNSNIPGQIKHSGVTMTSVQPGQVMVLTFNVIADEECSTAFSLNSIDASDIGFTELNVIGGYWELPLTKELTGISIYTAPTKTSYYIGDSLNTSGLQVQLTYSDNSTQVISTGFAISAFDSSTAGTKTITVTYGGKSASFTATVKTPTLTVSKSSTEMLVGDTETLTVSTDPSNQTVHWSSTNTNVVTVSNGKLTAVGAGTATVTAKFVYNGQTYSKNCTVTVQEPVPDGALRLDLPTSGIIGQQVQIPIVLEDVALGALDFTLQYDQTKLEFVSCTQNAFTNYSVNSNIPGQIKHSGVTMTSVQPGQVMVLTFNVIADEECGTAVSLNVTAACTDDIDSTELNLIGGTWNLPLEKELTGISIYTAPTKTSYYIGDSLNTSGLQVQLTYSDNSTQVISTGFAISAFDSSTAGTKTITVTYGGKSASFTATVKAPTLTVSKSSTEMLVGDTETLTVSTDPSNQTVHWSSTNTNVVTVSNGKLTAVGAGTATVTAKFVYNGQTYSKNCEVTVQEPVPDGALYIETPRGFVGKQVQIPVYLEGADVGALTFTVQYDTQKLQYISCSDMAFGMCSENNSTPGTVVFACIDNGVISAGKVCILTFEVVADTNTQTDIALSVSEACNDDNHPLYVTGGSWSMEIMKAIPGDVNDDGKITAVDARYVLQAASGARSLDEIQKTVADINGDGRISAVDARWILQVASGVRTL